MNRLTMLSLLVASAFCLQASSQTPADPGAAAPQDESHATMGARDGHGVGGRITAISAGKITLQRMDGKQVSVILTDSTQYHQDRQPAQFKDFKVGDLVLVRGAATSNPDEYTAEMVAKRSTQPSEGDIRDALGKKFIAGEIKAIDGLQLSILRPDGVTQNIKVDENTSFRKQGESLTLADFKVGDHVFGRGELKGGVFVPAVLMQGDIASFLGPGFGTGNSSQH